MTTYKITNEKLFKSKVQDVDVSGLASTNNHNNRYSSFSATGHVSIQLTDGDYVESDGQHGKRDFENEYGFILECVDND